MNFELYIVLFWTNLHLGGGGAILTRINIYKNLHLNSDVVQFSCLNKSCGR